MSLKASFDEKVHSALARLTAGVERIKVLVAISGGPDSTALLLAAASLKEAEVAAVHVNHNLRGQESADDERFCAELCKVLNVGYFSHTLDGGVADEARLRDARYAVFSAVAHDHNFAFVATGHTMDDQAETILFRMFRGSSISGLSGIPERRNLSGSTQVIRPMLNVRRDEVLDFLRDNKQIARLDSSNLQNHYSRNFIRNEIIPLINTRFSDAIAKIAQLSSQVIEDDYVWDELTETRSAAMFNDNHSCLLTALLSEPRALQRRILADQLRLRGIEVSGDRIASLIELMQNGGTITLNEEWRAVVKDGHLEFESIEDIENITDFKAEVEHIVHEGLNIIAELGCAIRLLPLNERPASFPAATADEAVVNLSNHKTPLIARIRRAGDVIQPFGMNETVRLKRYLQTHRRADGSHAGRPVVVASNGDILWVPGVGLSNKIRVDEYPTHRFEFILLTTDEFALA